MTMFSGFIVLLRVPPSVKITCRLPAISVARSRRRAVATQKPLRAHLADLALLQKSSASFAQTALSTRSHSSDTRICLLHLAYLRQRAASATDTSRTGIFPVH